MTATTKVLPADVFDTLEFSALVYGGIGGGSTREIDGVTPLCAYGHGYAATGPDDSTIFHALANAGLSASHNDTAVQRVNARRGEQYSYARISFENWCKELGVVRGES